MSGRGPKKNLFFFFPRSPSPCQTDQQTTPEDAAGKSAPAGATVTFTCKGAGAEAMLKADGPAADPSLGTWVDGQKVEVECQASGGAFADSDAVVGGGGAGGGGAGGGGGKKKWPVCHDASGTECALPDSTSWKVDDCAEYTVSKECTFDKCSTGADAANKPGTDGRATCALVRDAGAAAGTEPQFRGQWQPEVEDKCRPA